MPQKLYGDCNFSRWTIHLFRMHVIKLGEVGAHRASASQNDFWPRRRHADGDNDVSSEGGSSDVNEENRGGRGHRRCHVRREANFRHTSTEGDRQGSVAFHPCFLSLFASLSLQDIKT